MTGLWADQESFYLVTIDDAERGVLRIAGVNAKKDKLYPMKLVVRGLDQNYVFNEEDSVLTGQYAFALADTYGADQLIVYFLECSSKALAELIEQGELQGQVFDPSQKGESEFGGHTEVSVVLTDLSDQQLKSITRPGSSVCERLTWPLTRLRRFR